MVFLGIYLWCVVFSLLCSAIVIMEEKVWQRLKKSNPDFNYTNYRHVFLIVLSITPVVNLVYLIAVVTMLSYKYAYPDIWKDL